MEPTHNKKTVLVIEDHEPTFKVLRDALEKAGLSVLVARDGVAGLAMAEKQHPDIILLDILMPVMDGWKMLEHLRGKDGWGKTVPVIVLTNLSSSDEEQMRNITELGPSYFMTKADWTIDAIIERVIETLKLPKPTN